MCNYLPPIIIFHYPHRKFQHRYLLENKRVFQVLGIPTIHETRFIQILQTWKTLKCIKWIASCKVQKLKIGVLVYNLLTAIIFLKIFYLTKQSDLETTWALSRFRLSHKDAETAQRADEPPSRNRGRRTILPLPIGVVHASDKFWKRPKLFNSNRLKYMFSSSNYNCCF